MRPELKNISDSDMESVISVEEPIPSGNRGKTRKYVCSFDGCGEIFRRMVHLDRHEYKHSGIRKYACAHHGCSKTYSNITHLKRHNKISHENIEKTKDVKCRFEFCSKMFSSVYSMERHIREVHENPKIYTCTHCDEKFKQKIKLRRHEVKHTGVYPFNCSKCLKGFVQEYFFHRHACKSYKCDQCQATFEKWSELMAHRKTSNHKTLHKCEECKKTFSSKFHLSEHKKIHNGEVFQCPHEGCTRFYSYRYSLTQHIQTVHEGKKIPCTVEGCDMKLSCKRALVNHIKVIHSARVEKSKLTKKERSKRKDAGKRKQSTLSKLSGVVLEKHVDKMIMEGTAEIEIDLQTIEEEVHNEKNRADDDDIEDQQLTVLKVKEHFIK